MPTLELQRPFETPEPRLRVENILLPGRHRFRLIVVDNDGIESDPVETLVTIVGPLPGSDALVRGREARGRVFYATGVLPDAPGQTPGSAYEVKLYLRQEPGPPPLPPPAWPVFTRTDGARRELQDAIFAAWHEGDDSSDQGGPKSLPEHVPGQDPTSVFLARLLLPATLPATGGPPIRTAGEVVVDNRSRRFVYPPAALARWVGL